MVICFSAHAIRNELHSTILSEIGITIDRISPGLGIPGKHAHPPVDGGRVIKQGSLLREFPDRAVGNDLLVYLDHPAAHLCETLRFRLRAIVFLHQVVSQIVEFEAVQGR